jgi:predicted MFS family arabinose efflux permease
MIGSMIGLTFALSLVAAPALYRAIGMSGLFALTGVFALAAIWVVAALVPATPPRAHAAPGGVGLAAAFAPDLLRLNFGIFVLHMVQMAMFVVLPPLLIEAGLALTAHWKLYLPVLLGSFALMLPPILYADRRNRPKPVMIGMVALLAAVQSGLVVAGADIAILAALMLAFFVAFNALEALLPSLVSRLAPAQGRGAAIGVYNTTQTLGLFVGGLAGGWLAKHYGAGAVFGVGALLALAWFAVVLGMRAPARAGTVNEASGLALGGKQRT